MYMCMYSVAWSRGTLSRGTLCRVTLCRVTLCRGTLCRSTLCRSTLCGGIGVGTATPTLAIVDFCFTNLIGLLFTTNSVL